MARPRRQPARARGRPRRRLLRDGGPQSVVIASEEIHEAFRAARRGKVAHWGLSTHGTRRPSSTPPRDRAVLARDDRDHARGLVRLGDEGHPRGTRPMAELEPTLARARAAGVGLIGMKAGRHLAGRASARGGRRRVRRATTTPATPRSALALPAQLRLRARARPRRGQRGHAVVAHLGRTSVAATSPRSSPSALAAVYALPVRPAPAREADQARDHEQAGTGLGIITRREAIDAGRNATMSGREGSSGPHNYTPVA